MTNPSINFKVGGEQEVSSFMGKLKKDSESLTSQLIKDAQIQTSSAKEQLKLLEEQVRGMQRLATLRKQISEASVKDNTLQRLSGIESRGSTIDLLFERNKQAMKELVANFKSGNINEDDFKDERGKLTRNRRRIETLADQNTEGEIRRQGELKLKEVRESERNNQILASYMRENINTIRQTSQQQVNTIKQGNEKLVDTVDENSSPQQQLTQQLTQQQLGNQKKEEESSNDWRKKASGILGFANALAIDRVGGTGELTITIQ
jgi:hypothetical protein